MSVAANTLEAGGIPQMGQLTLLPVFPDANVIAAARELNLFDQYETLRAAADKAIEASSAHYREHGVYNEDLQRAARDANEKFFALWDQIIEVRPELNRGVSRRNIDVSPAINPLRLRMGVVLAAMDSLVDPDQEHYGSVQDINGPDVRALDSMYRYGGIGVIAHSTSDDAAVAALEKLKSADRRYPNALLLRKETRVQEARRLLMGEPPDAVGLIVDNAQHLQGIVNLHDLRSKQPNDSVGSHMKTGNIITAEEGINPTEALEMMERHNVHSLPILTKDGKAKYLFTRKTAAYAELLPSSGDANEAFGALVAIGPNGGWEGVRNRIRKVLDAGARGIILETAHAARRNILDLLKRVREEFGENIFVGFGTTLDPMTAQAVASSGYRVDMLKVGIGGGGHCTTADATGIRTDSWWASRQCGEMLESIDPDESISVMADGGMDNRWKVALMLSNRRVNYAQIGTWFMEVAESAAERHWDAARGVWTIETHGMAAATSETKRRGRRQAEHGMQAHHEWLEEHGRLVHSEGASRITELSEEPEKRLTIADILYQIRFGLASAASYSDARDMKEFQARARVARVG